MYATDPRTPAQARLLRASGPRSIFLIEGGLYSETAMRKAKSKNTVYSRHPSKPPNQKTLRLVEAPRLKSYVVESFRAILLHAAAPRVEVGVLEGVVPALRGPFVT